jgi:glycosyltransferase involved in cell wall biosynthesis
MSAFTGGCELDEGCGRFADVCGRCPLIGSTRTHDLTWLTMQRKRRAWADRPIHLVAMSSWIRDQAARSSLFAGAEIPVIHPGIDSETFRPTDRVVARQALRLPADRAIVAFSSLSDHDIPHKGWPELLGALETLLQRRNGARPLLVLLIGLEQTPSDLARLPIETVALGVVRDTALLALAYSAADVLALPSRQETFGKVAAEALACATPVVCFDRLGVADVVEHRGNGYLASQGSIEDFASGLAWVLDDAPAAALAGRARETAVERLSPEAEARAYRELYGAVVAGEAACSTHPR